MDKRIITLDEEFENAKKEIRMWREIFINEGNITDISMKSIEEFEFIEEKIRTAPIGLANIEEFIQQQLKCYRET